MTQITHCDQDVRRHRDGSIDFDHYRARATALRGAALRDAGKVRSMLRFVAILTVTTVGVAFVASALAPVVDASCHQCTRILVPVDAAGVHAHRFISAFIAH